MSSNIEYETSATFPLIHSANQLKRNSHQEIKKFIMQHAGYGSLVADQFITYPVETLMRRKQFAKKLLTANKKHSFFPIFPPGYFRGLTHGFGYALINKLFTRTYRLNTQDKLQKKLNKNFKRRPSATFVNAHATMLSELIAGEMAASSETVIFQLLDVKKLRAQLNTDRPLGIYKPIAYPIKIGKRVLSLKVPHIDLKVIKSIKPIDLKNLYNSVNINLLRNMTCAGILFPSYAAIMKRLGCKDKEQADKWHKAIGAAGAAMITGALTNPLDVLRTRLQGDPNSGYKSLKGILSLSSQMAKTEGMRVFARGVGSKVFFQAPIKLALPLFLFQCIKDNNKEEYNNNEHENTLKQ